MPFDDNLDQKINIHITGRAMDATLGFELKYLLDILKEIQSLIEKTYLHSNDKERMNASDYEILKVIIDEPKKGSFDSNIFIKIQDALIPLLPVLAENGVSIWGAIKQTYEYLKVIIDTRKAGKEVSIEQSGNGIIVTGNNNTITVNEVTPELANKLSPTFHNLSKSLDGENIEEIKMFSDSGEGVTLTIEDNERFKRKTLLSEDTVQLEGKIIAADAENFTGKIEVDGVTYPFEIDDKYKNEEFFSDSFTKAVSVECQQKIKIDPSKEEFVKVIGLKIHQIDII